MNIKKLVAILIFTAAAHANTAQAAFTTFDFDLGTVVDGQNGQFNLKGRAGDFVSYMRGTLPSNLRIDFQYSLDAGTSSILVNSSGYDYFDGGHHYQGGLVVDSSSSTFAFTEVDGAPSSHQMLFATADIGTGKTSVTNRSTGNVGFVEVLQGILAAIGNRTLHITYAVSSVPLPAMAPLFGAALMGLRFAARRKAKAA